MFEKRSAGGEDKSSRAGSLLAFGVEEIHRLLDELPGVSILLGDDVVDIVAEDLADAGTALRVLVAEVLEPAVVGLDAGPPLDGRGQARWASAAPTI